MFKNTDTTTYHHPNNKNDFMNRESERFFRNCFATRDHWMEIEKEWIFGPKALHTDS